MTSTPNVLLIVADQHRYDWTGTSGYNLPVRTPVLDSLAARGAVLRRTVTPAPLCAPARACLATGRHYDANPVPNNAADLPLDVPTYYRLLRDIGGYYVTGSGKFDLHKGTLDWDLDGSRLLHEWGLSAGIDNEGKLDAIWSGWPAARGPYMNYLHRRELAETHVLDFRARLTNVYGDTRPTPLPDDAYLDNWIADNALLMLAQRPAGVPWHMIVNFAGPHDPMDVTASMQAAWRDVEFPVPVISVESSGQDHQEIRRNYAAMIENIDRHVGRMLEEVAARGELDNTLVIYTSDHGEMLGDHGLWGKHVYYQPSIQVPLIVSGPGVQPGLVSDALVALEDVAATILDYAGVVPDPMMTARSFRTLIEGRSVEHRSFVVSGLDRSEREVASNRQYESADGWVQLTSWRALVTDTSKLVVSPEIEHPLLFDLESDPEEQHDRSAEDPVEIAHLTALLRDAIGLYA